MARLDQPELAAVSVKPQPDGRCWACREGIDLHRVQFIDGYAWILCEVANFGWKADMRQATSVPLVNAP